jgi:hypothetical protein
MVGVPAKTRTWQLLDEKQKRRCSRQLARHVKSEVSIFCKPSNAIFLLPSIE